MTTSSEANLPTVARILFADRRNDRLAWFIEHLNFRARTVKTPNS